MNAQEQLWAGEFGDSYTARNRVDWRARIPFWRHIIDVTGARSVYELGSNAGWNLSAILRVDPLIQVYGDDYNERALVQARSAGLPVPETPEFCELTYTAGVLIHVAPDSLADEMQRLVSISTDYVLAVEYEADEETEIEYRGQMGRLWKRPFGRLYEQMGLTLVEEGEAVGFDRCTYWLLRK